jgi:hypothetical protein
LNKQFSKIVRAMQGSVAQAVVQPNKKASIALVLTPDEIPGGGWTTYLKRDIPAHSFDARDPIKIRVKNLQYTTSRRSFKKPPTSKLIFIEVTPLATPADAQSWTLSARSRQEKKLIGLADVFDFRVLDHLDVSNVDAFEGYSFSTNRPRGILKTLALAASIGNIHLTVACSDFDQSWTIKEVLEVESAQVEKIRTLKNEQPI